MSPFNRMPQYQPGFRFDPYAPMMGGSGVAPYDPEEEALNQERLPQPGVMAPQVAPAQLQPPPPPPIAAPPPPPSASSDYIQPYVPTPIAAQRAYEADPVWGVAAAGRIPETDYMDPEIQGILSGNPVRPPRPQIPPNPAGDTFEPERPRELDVLFEHAQRFPERPDQPWWKKAAGIALSGINLAPAQIGARKLLYGDYPQQVGQWKEEQEALQKAAEESNKFSGQEIDFQQARETGQTQLAVKGLVKIDRGSSGYDPAAYDYETVVNGQVYGQPKKPLDMVELMKGGTFVSAEEARKRGIPVPEGQQGVYLPTSVANTVVGAVVKEQEPTAVEPNRRIMRLGTGEKIAETPPADYNLPEATKRMSGETNQPVAQGGPRTRAPGSGRGAAGQVTPSQQFTATNQIESATRADIEAIANKATRMDAAKMAATIMYAMGKGPKPPEAGQTDNSRAFQRVLAARESQYRALGMQPPPLSESYLSALGISPDQTVQPREITSWEELESGSGPGRPATPPPPPSAQTQSQDNGEEIVVKRADLPRVAAAAGVSVADYEAMAPSNNIRIVP